MITTALKQKVFVANWKMYKSCNTAYSWCQQYKEEVEQLATQCHLIICPEFTALWPIKKLFNGAVNIGAQNCAAQAEGPYTGEVSVNSLVDIGCTHCIVGHSERRFDETLATINEKITVLLNHGISPIVCMGETQEEKEGGQTMIVLQKQLDNVASAASKSKPSSLPIYIAYEPIWAIGGSKTPTSEELSKLYDLIIDYTQALSLKWQIKALYGGSVSSKNIQELQKLPFIDGFLLGRSSLDFQELKKIVSLERV